MGLKSLLQGLKNRTAVPCVPSEKSAQGTLEPAWIGRVPLVPPVPPHFSDAHEIVLAGQPGQGASDPASEQPDEQKNLPKPAFSPAAENCPAPVPSADPEAWRVLAQAYYAHHFKCPVCIAAGRGTGYGFRCGTGAALWTGYDRAR
jgi:hypothetical protein